MTFGLLSYRIFLLILSAVSLVPETYWFKVMYDRLGMGLTRPYGLIDGFLLSMATLETHVGHSPPVQKVSDLITSSQQ